MVDLVKRIAVIIVNYRTPELTIECVNALEDARQAFPDLRVVVVDGASGDGSDHMIGTSIANRGQEGWVSLLPLPVNGGFAFANNRALMALGKGENPPDAIALINPDARVRPGALETMAALLARESGAGAVGARLEHEDGRTQSSAFRFPSVRSEACRGAKMRLVERLLGEPPSRIDIPVAAEVPWVTGAAVMFRTAALQEVGLFDEGFFLYFEETDLMRRLRKGGWSIWHEPAARVVHMGGVATQIRDPETGLPRRQRMPRYWYESRRRYFALAGGRRQVIASGIAWLVGHVAWRGKQIVTRRPNDGVQRAIGDFVDHGLWPGPHDVEPAIPTFGSVPDAEPAWMKARG